MSNKNFQRAITLTITGTILLSMLGCQKYLDKKPVLSLSTPATLKDLQALLDQSATINFQGCDMLEVGCDNYYARTSDYFTSTPADQLSYLWDPSAGTNATSYWTGPYGVIYIVNSVLDRLPQIGYDAKDSAQYKSIKGSAMFYRSFYFYELAQLFCQPYSNSNKSSLGIPLRTTAAIEVKSVRSTLQQTYDQIINDLKAAAELLPATSQYPTRPSKAACYGMLARTCLSMGDYANAGFYANQSLQLVNSLMIFQNLIPGAIPHFNVETIYYNIAPSISTIYKGNRGRIDSVLYASYSANDLRKTVFFSNNGDNTYRFFGGYDGDYSNNFMFDGITTDEMYLVRAEAAARAGNKTAALADLNTLLQTRWKTGTFAPFSAATPSDALSLILTERRKELIHRGLRWTDIRRLNVEGANITLTRIINGLTYTLPPNDLRCAYLIPQIVIDRSGLIQNPR